MPRPRSAGDASMRNPGCSGRSPVLPGHPQVSKKGGVTIGKARSSQGVHTTTPAIAIAKSFKSALGHLLQNRVPRATSAPRFTPPRRQDRRTVMSGSIPPRMRFKLDQVVLGVGRTSTSPSLLPEQTHEDTAAGPDRPGPRSPTKDIERPECSGDAGRRPPLEDRPPLFVKPMRGARAQFADVVSDYLHI